MKKGRTRWTAWLLLPVSADLALTLLMGALAHVDASQSEEGRNQLEESIRRAAVSSYASEGVYPATLEELEQGYGIQVDETRYAVFYEIFADNIMPEITVLAR